MRPPVPLLASLALLCATLLTACGESAPPVEAPAADSPAAPAEPPGAATPQPVDEPPPLDNVPPQTIAEDLPLPAPADEAALDAARQAAEALFVAVEGADQRLATSGMPDATQLATTDLLRKIAHHTRRKRRVPFRVVHAPLWDELKAQAEPDLKAFDGAKRAARVRAAAAMLTEGGDAYDRAAGAALLRLALELREAGGGDLAADAPIRDALLARIPTAADDDEARRSIYELLGTAPTARLTPAFLAAGRDDLDEQVRRDALGALAVCARAGRCSPAPGALRAIYRHTLPESVHSALVEVGAALKMPAVSDWCAGEKRLMRSLACRTGLAGMETPAAFDRLLPYVTARDQDPITHGGRHYGFRDDFALLDRYADAGYATERYYALLDTALGRVTRNGFATGFIVRRMGTLADAKRALALLDRHRPAYVERWGAAPTARSLRFLYVEWDHARAVLEARIEGRAPPPRPAPEAPAAKPAPGLSPGRPAPPPPGSPVEPPEQP